MLPNRRDTAGVILDSGGVLIRPGRRPLERLAVAAPAPPGRGLDRFVKAMVISAEEGVSKPDARVFQTAPAALGQPVACTVFVDDWPEHVEAANRLGIGGIRLRHDAADATRGLEEISDLRAMLELIGWR
jgi:hypothetical protein